MPWRTALVVALCAVALGCFPKPDDPIEWVERPESIVVQVRSSESETPTLTLYGDGVVIYDAGGQLVESRVGRDDIERLLEDIESTGYFNFRYDQPEPPVDGGATSFYYVNTREGTNAVRVYAIDAEAPDGDEWDQFREMQGIASRLDELVGELAGEPYVEPMLPFEENFPEFDVE